MNAVVQPLCQPTGFLQVCKLTCAMVSALLQLPMCAPELLQQPEVSTCLQPQGTSAQCLLHDLVQLFLRVNAISAAPMCCMVTLCACAASPGPGLAILLTRTWPPMTHACCVNPCRWCCGDMNHLDLGRRAFQEVGGLPCNNGDCMHGASQNYALVVTAVCEHAMCVVEQQHVGRSRHFCNHHLGGVCIHSMK
jgi:hypothetical protein